jgi:hypothetical protein
LAVEAALEIHEEKEEKSANLYQIAAKKYKKEKKVLRYRLS